MGSDGAHALMRSYLSFPALEQRAHTEGGDRLLDEGQHDVLPSALTGPYLFHM